ncbi:methyl-CpG-binding domain-containing protein 13-like isoform X5 [Olea europaea var. sylvestris]|uniref:methyl-CpG-binding domain-containing protein 13-like isoform X5 n=1 Tax=Olea europaea var. sylvestris TaxID=158386 RepID=UPI000C1D3AEE|nr:methyl-CpG-binding domain-containing protein 13-like isoform X5 [Olea europaea var. sylvestris]
MLARKAPEWLPPGYTEKIKVKNGRKIKYYCNVATGKEFYSKKDVISCAETEEIFHGTPQRRSNEDKKFPNDKIDLLSQTSVEENESTDWLPNGWVMEERQRKGSSSKASTYKVYINPADERKFYSKRAVVRYLKTMEQSSTIAEQVKHDCIGESSLIPDLSQQCKAITGPGCTPNENKEGNDEHSLNMSTSVDGLPPGWTKEIKMGRSGSRTRKYYTDPVSGYIFYSKTDVFRYLETNDIGSCAVRPKKRMVNDQELIKNEIPHDNVDESPLKQDVSEHNELMTKSCCTSKDNKVGDKKQSLDMVQVAIHITSEDGLPPGWTKEIKRRKSGRRMKVYPLYTDPVSGYKFRSKLDALRYLETNDIRSCRTRPIKKQVDDQELIKNDIPASFDNISNCTVRSFQHDNVHESASNQDVFQESKLMVTSSCTPKRDKIHKVKRSSKKVTIQSTSADELPPGWIKEIKTSVSGSKMRKDPYYTDPVSGYVFRSKKDVLRYLETNNIASCLTRPKKRELDNLLTHEIPVSKKHENVDESSLKQDASEECKLLMSSGCTIEENEGGNNEYSLKMVATQSPSADELPAGWKAEIKTGKFGKVRKIFINPLSGSKFYSKPAVARYLKSIENSSTTSEQNKSSSPVDEKLSENLETKRQLFVDGKESLDTEKLAASEAKILEENPGNNSSNNAILTCENKLKCAATDNGLRPTNEGSEKEVTVMVDDVAIDSHATSLLTEQKLPESGVEKQSCKTQSCSRISKKSFSQDLPRRTSKRLAGCKPDMPPNTILNESVEDKNPTDTEAIKSSNFSSNIVADGVLQPSAIEPVKEVADHASVGDEILKEIEPSNKTEKLLTGQAFPEDQKHGKAIENQENDNSRSQDSQLFYPFSESWSDPCLEFAFKTLTGEIPLDDNLGFLGFQQQVDIPYNQTNGCSLPPDVPTNFQNEVTPLPSSFQQVDIPYNQTNRFLGSPVVSTIFQNEVPPLPSQFQQHGAVVQSLPNPLLPSPGNSSFSSSSGINLLLPSKGARNKDFQTR